MIEHLKNNPSQLFFVDDPEVGQKTINTGKYFADFITSEGWDDEDITADFIPCSEIGLCFEYHGREAFLPYCYDVNGVIYLFEDAEECLYDMIGGESQDWKITRSDTGEIIRDYDYIQLYDCRNGEFPLPPVFSV